MSLPEEYGLMVTTVQLADTTPIVGVTVYMQRVSDSVIFQGTTNSSGVCSYQLANGAYNIWAGTQPTNPLSTGGYYKCAPWSVTVSYPNTTSRTLTLTPYTDTLLNHYYLYVYRQNGVTPISGAHVSVTQVTGAHAGRVTSATTDANGRIDFTGSIALYAAAYTGSVTATGFYDGTFSSPFNMNQEGGQTTWLMIALPPSGGNLIVQVYDYLTHAAVPTASVYLYKTDYSYFYGPNTTDSSGQVTITNLPVQSGLYDVEITKTGYTTSDYTSANLIRGTTFTVYLHPVAFVVHCVNTKSLDVSGASVTLTGGVTRNVVTDVNGNAWFYQIPAGTYTLTATCTGYNNYSEGSVAVSDNGLHSITLTPSVFTFTVTDYSTHVAVLAAQIVIERSDTTVFNALTDASGQGIVYGVTTDTYEIWVNAASYKAYHKTGQSFTAGNNYTIYLISTNPSTAFNITFKDTSTQLTLPGVAVSMVLNSDPTLTYSATSDGSGVASITGLSFGYLLYTFTATLTGYISYTEAYFSAKDNTSTTIWLTPLGVIGGGTSDWSTQVTVVSSWDNAHSDWVQLADVSDYVVSEDWWREDHFYQSRFEVKLWNPAQMWTNYFQTGNQVAISVDGELMFVGILEDAEDEVQEGYVDYAILTLKGEGTERNLHQIYITKNYPDGTISLSDDIVEDSLNLGQAKMLAGQLITYFSPSTGTPINIKFNRSYLADKYKQTCEDTFSSGYVDNNYLIKFFSEGTSSSGGALINDSSDSRNVLKMIYGAYAGAKIRNYVEVYGKSVKDHWTDSAHYNIAGTENPSWTTDNNCADWGADSYAAGPNYVKEEHVIMMPSGTSSLAFKPNTLAGNGVNTYFSIKMHFPICSYSYLNLMGGGEGSFWVYWDAVYTADTTYVRPRFRDRNDNIIEYYSKAVPLSENPVGPTEMTDLRTYTWRQIPFAVNASIDDNINVNAQTQWYYVSRAGALTSGVDFTSMAVQVDDGTGHSKLTFTGGFPFSTWAPGMEFDMYVSDQGSWTSPPRFHVYEVNTTNNYIRTLERLPGSDSGSETNCWLKAGMDWSQITDMKIMCAYKNDHADYPIVLLDWLELPMVQPISIFGDSTSQTTYGLRMYKEARPDSMSQRNLDDIAYQLLVTGTDPVQSLHVWADGQTATKYAGDTVDVTSTQYGLTLEAYRIVKLHHSLSAKSALRLGLGYNWVTEYELLRHSYGGVVLSINHTRLDAIKRIEVVTLDKLLNLTDRMTQDEVAALNQTYEN